MCLDKHLCDELCTDRSKPSSKPMFTNDKSWYQRKHYALSHVNGLVTMWSCEVMQNHWKLKWSNPVVLLWITQCYVYFSYKKWHMHTLILSIYYSSSYIDQIVPWYLDTLETWSGLLCGQIKETTSWLFLHDVWFLFLCEYPANLVDEQQYIPLIMDTLSALLCFAMVWRPSILSMSFRVAALAVG